MSLAECPVIPVVLEKHPNADALSIVKFKGYQTIVKTDDFRDVSTAVFIPPDYVVDSEFPATSWLKGHERIKVRKLRGERSEGVLIPVKGLPIGTDAMGAFGITKWESPADKAERNSAPKRPPFRWYSPRSWYYWLWKWNDKRSSHKAAPPMSVHKYDVESYARFPVFKDGEECVATEKIHGTNARFVYSSKTKRLHVGSHTTWKRRGAADWWNAAVDQNPWIERVCQANPDCVFYGEVYGRSVQTLDYGKPKGQFGLRLFDIKEPSLGFAGWERVTSFWWDDKDIKVNWVPVICRGPWDENTFRSYVSGRSTMPYAHHLREGIVIEPVKPRDEQNLGRVKLKMVSADYLNMEE